jgi:hypothetical protein
MNAGPKTHSSAKPRPGSPMKLAPSRSATATVLKKQAAHNKALQDKQATTQGRADGGRNSSNSITIAKGPESQSCKGCGFVGGSWKSCRRNDKRSALLRRCMKMALARLANAEPLLKKTQTSMQRGSDEWSIFRNDQRSGGAQFVTLMMDPQVDPATGSNDGGRRAHEAFEPSSVGWLRKAICGAGRLRKP